MGPHAKSTSGGRLKRASAVVRAWDGPNSRIAFEMDLDQMPWGPFEALGKRVTLLVPEREDGPEPATADGSEPSGAESDESQLERALRHVEHAAQRCAEFAELGNGSDQVWRSSLETWEWLRDFLTSAWTETPTDGTATDAPSATSSDRAAPGTLGAEPETRTPELPGAAATLEVAASALRETPLAVWREAVGTFNPGAPTREEAIQTLLGVARLLGRSRDPADGVPNTAPDRGEEGTVPGAGARTTSGSSRSGGAREEPAEAGGDDASAAASSSPTTPAQTSGGTADSAREGSPAPTEAATAPERTPSAGADELSFDYAAGYDEGYRMGRRVGRALAARDRENRQG